MKRKLAFVGETTTVDINQKTFNAKTGKENISFQDNDESMLRYLFLFVLVMYFRKLFSQICVRSKFCLTCGKKLSATIEKI